MNLPFVFGNCVSLSLVHKIQLLVLKLFFAFVSLVGSTIFNSKHVSILMFSLFCSLKLHNVLSKHKFECAVVYFRIGVDVDVKVIVKDYANMHVCMLLFFASLSHTLSFL